MGILAQVGRDLKLPLTLVLGREERMVSIFFFFFFFMVFVSRKN